MRIVGLSGGPNAVHERAFEVFPGALHDAAAVLLVDGEVVAAVEQERLDRIKHSNKGPFDAVRACLEIAHLGAGDIDHFAFYGGEESWNRMLARHFLHHPGQAELVDAATLLRRALQRELGCALPAGQPQFVRHHLAHAVSAMALSGFERALVVTLDGEGDELSGLVLDAEGTTYRALCRLPVDCSLGYLYLHVIEFLGYRIFDEYKVMGLAPYGDPARFAPQLEALCTLAADGEYEIHWDRLPGLFEVVRPRRPGEEITQVHKDLAAGLQRTLEQLVFHLLGYWRRATGLRHLCLAGGVAHNCTVNGKLLAAGLFDDVFVQPAAHDAGCALGAALDVDRRERAAARSSRSARPAAGPRLAHVYWGRDLGTADEVAAVLTRWQRFLEWERAGDVVAEAARHLADGAVIGWVQGRSEFGPRALGNRSILADPRPAAHKDLINAMVKKREAYRPFAPSVPEEHVAEYFDVPPGQRAFPFMVFTLSVRADKRELLGAVTHVDGTARLQTVARAANERYWRLLQEFGRHSGVPILLNTSFNNNAEPIVESAEDAVVCFLTTGLHLLVVGDFVVRRRPVATADFLTLVPELPRQVELGRTRSFAPETGWADLYEVATNDPGRPRRPVGRELFELLAEVDGRRALGELLAGADQAAGEQRVAEMRALWAEHLVRLRPAGDLG